MNLEKIKNLCVIGAVISFPLTPVMMVITSPFLGGCIGMLLLQICSGFLVATNENPEY